MSKRLIILIIILFSQQKLLSQLEKQSIDVDILPSFCHRVFYEDMYPYKNKYYGFGLSGRINYFHKKLLGLSLETDYIQLASNKIKNLEFEGQKINADLSKFANTLLLELNYDYKSFRINGGIGFALISSEINAFGKEEVNDDINLCYVLSMNYKYYLTNNTSIFPQVKFNYFNNIEATVLSFGIGVNYPIYSF